MLMTLYSAYQTNDNPLFYIKEKTKIYEKCRNNLARNGKKLQRLMTFFGEYLSI